MKKNIFLTVYTPYFKPYCRLVSKHRVEAEFKQSCTICADTLALLLLCDVLHCHCTGMTTVHCSAKYSNPLKKSIKFDCQRYVF